MFDARAQFRRSFVPTDGGYLYYPHRWSGGYLITEDELETIMADPHNSGSFTVKLKFYGVVFGALSAMVMIGIALEFSDQQQRWLSFAFAIGLACYLVFRSSSVKHLIRNRQPVAPRRSSLEAERAMSKAMGKPVLVFLSWLVLWFVFAAVVNALDNPVLGVPLVFVAASFAFLTLRLTWRGFFP